jgi:hypothetical protein
VSAKVSEDTGSAASRISLEQHIAFIDVQIRVFQSGPPHLGLNRALAISGLRRRQAALLAELAAR